MKKNRGCPGGSASFLESYRVLYGERWSTLVQALAIESSAIPFAAAPEAEPYFLDSSSIRAAMFLPLSGGEVLDACAAPGGKTLVLASRLAEGYRILANELSSDRRRRLSTVLDRHLPAHLRTRVRVSGDDASSMCLRNALRFSSILLDAPCSSERHVLKDPKALDEWTPSRPKNLARRQWSLLASAFLMLKPGGWLVYSTCSLNPGENEEVVARLVGKYGNDVAVDAPTEVPWESRLHGAIILPDRAAGAGPLYLARIRKPG
ncbi:MAG: 16S rRNA methyltransferase [Spirochaetota bacterium]